MPAASKLAGPWQVVQRMPDGAEIVDAAHDQRHVRMPVVTLRRPVAGRMAVDAARMGDDLAGLLEQRQRALLVVGDGGKGLHRAKRLGRIGLRGGDGHADGDDRQQRRREVSRSSACFLLTPLPRHA